MLFLLIGLVVGVVGYLTYFFIKQAIQKKKELKNIVVNENAID